MFLAKKFINITRWEIERKYQLILNLKKNTTMRQNIELPTRLSLFTNGTWGEITRSFLADTATNVSIINVK